MQADSSSLFAQVIQEHLELKERNSALEGAMPLQTYRSDDPFENHPLFKTEEQARLEETMDGEERLPEEAVAAGPEGETVEASLDQEASSDEGLWGRSRDFDWGD
jgi:hypothetical protein